MKIYVGNLSFETTQAQLTELFAKHGEVRTVSLITDRETGRPRGFGFVEMGSEQAARAAIGALDGGQFGGRSIKVNEAKPREGNGPQRRW